MQNLFLPVYDRAQSPRVLFRRDEPLADTVYQALCVLTREAGFEFSIDRIRFERTSDSWSLRLIDREGLEDNVAFAITGQPILFDDEITPHQVLAAVTYDLRHAWHLEWEDWQQNARDRDTHAALMDCMMTRLRAPVLERAGAMGRIAAQAGLQIQDGYLHSSISVSGDSLHLVMMHGSFEQVARTHRRLGARRAILLDNGGSVGMATWTRRAWTDAVARGASLPPPPTFVGSGSYFRPRGHAVVLAELKEDILDMPFRRRTRADAPWIREENERS
jgi:hypothetical protein